MSTMLIVGLGNPGPKYAGTRHNIGHMVLDQLASDISSSFSTFKGVSAETIEGRLGSPGFDSVRVVLAKTTSFMNVSGLPVKQLANFFKIPPEQVIVVHDDIDLAFDTVRLKLGGGEGGHNGLKDISRQLATKDYLRVRVGVGRPTARMDVADWVLGSFTSSERKVLPNLINDAVDATCRLALEGLTKAQQHVHSQGGAK